MKEEADSDEIPSREQINTPWSCVYESGEVSVKCVRSSADRQVQPG